MTLEQRIQVRIGCYGYRISPLPGGSERYGACEICHGAAKIIYHQVEAREYEPGQWTYHECHDLFGHADCLIAKRKPLA